MLRAVLIVAVDNVRLADDTLRRYRPHKTPANTHITTRAVDAVGLLGILTACTLVLRLADTVSMDERRDPQCFSVGSRKVPNIQPRSNHFTHASSSGGAVPVGVV
jgi:hypothetical protein